MTLIRLCYLNSALQGAVSLDKKKNELGQDESNAEVVSAPPQTPKPATIPNSVAVSNTPPSAASAPAVNSVANTVTPAAAPVAQNPFSEAKPAQTPSPVSTPVAKPQVAATSVANVAQTTSTANAGLSLKGLSREQLQKQAREQLEQIKQQATAPAAEQKEATASTKETKNTLVEEVSTANANNGKPYTPAQRFDALSNKYPDLINFTKILNLDVDW
jgi:hypothetical protein